MVLLGIVPGLEESISHGQCSGLISSEIIEIESSSSKGVFNMVNDLSLNRLSVVTEIGLHELPHLLSSLLRSIVFELRLNRKWLNFLKFNLLYIRLNFLNLAGRIWTLFYWIWQVADSMMAPKKHEIIVVKLTGSPFLASLAFGGAGASFFGVAFGAI